MTTQRHLVRTLFDQGALPTEGPEAFGDGEIGERNLAEALRGLRLAFGLSVECPAR
ncbi:hypothetical protein ACIOEX_20985 [Streptomyces sp. NPDC087850]|uniref:hypothetical protein n=1 Tax=Streptomyces sp. NPDC087850 TaxID=3365809 RepID=UPI003818729D